jgi:PleD family two-component response regulator
MIALADQLMYEAKHGGRNQVRARQLGEPIERAS